LSAPDAPRSRRVLASALVVGIAAVVLISVLATRSAPPAVGAHTLLGGKVAPPITGRDIRTGKAISLAQYRGRYVVVNFFASWCVPCQTEAAALESFAFAHRARGDAVVLGVVYADSVGNARAFLERSGATWGAVADPGSTIAVAYGVAAPPQTFIVGPGGRVVGYIEGAVTTAELDAAIASGGTT
jgi:cytochrome c biogenesis protein CcmG/thiol:disulfide interchange protein DsbE